MLSALLCYLCSTNDEGGSVIALMDYLMHPIFKAFSMGVISNNVIEISNIRFQLD